MKEKKNNSTKVVILLALLMLLIGGAVGGTLAWLIANTTPITNIFTVGNISITLEETGATLNGSEYTKSFKMVPGADIAKDPQVTVEGGSEACWLFVQVSTEGNVVLGHDQAAADTYVTYEIDTTVWTELESGVYYKQVAASAADQEFGVLTNNIVKVPDTVTKAMMDALTGGTATTPKLTFTAYAVQQANGSAIFTAEQAWNIANGLNLTELPIPKLRDIF